MLEECLILAQKVAANRPRSSYTYTGAASVSALYNPYEGVWEVSVSWMCSTTIEYFGITINEACEKVIEDLKIILKE